MPGQQSSGAPALTASCAPRCTCFGSTFSRGLSEPARFQGSTLVLGLVASVLLSVIPAPLGGGEDAPPSAAGVRPFDPARHLPRRCVGCLHIPETGELAGAFGSSPVLRSRIEAVLEAAVPYLPAPAARRLETVRPALAEAMTQVSGAFTVTVRSLETAGLPDVIAVVELKGETQALAASIDRCGVALAVMRGGEPHVERFVVREAYAADAYHTARGPLFRCRLGTHLVITTSRKSLREVTRRYAGLVRSPGLGDSPLWSAAPAQPTRRNASPAVHAAVDLREVCRQLAPLPEGNRERNHRARAWHALLGAAGLSEPIALRLTATRHALTWSLATSRRPSGLLAVLRAGLGNVQALGEPARARRRSAARLSGGPRTVATNVARWIPAGTREVTAVAVRPGKALHALERFLRRRIPELSAHLDALYRRLEARLRLKIDVRRALRALPEVTVYRLSAGGGTNGPAGGDGDDAGDDARDGDQAVFLVATSTLNEYWSLLESAGTRAAVSADIEQLRVPLAPPLARAGRPATPLLLARVDLGGGWSALASEPAALARYLRRAREEPSLAEFPAVAARLLDGLQGATWAVATVDRDALTAICNQWKAEMALHVALGGPWAAPATEWIRQRWMRLAKALPAARDARDASDSKTRAWRLTLAGGLRPAAPEREARPQGSARKNRRQR